ncbi:MAG: leucine--tRNA ligase [Chloroflexi bacterium]|nr:leucine--tRNA ligase [Chloroflexota bacterium]
MATKILSKTKKPTKTTTKPVARAAVKKVAAKKPAAKKAATRKPATTSRRRAPRRDRYAPTAIEARWQKRWEQDGLYRTDLNDHGRKKFYFLTMYPYPSGDLHIGHWYAMSPSDAAARYRRMKGYHVFFPMGFDAFGLPAENAAIKRGIHPYKWTMKNIANMRRQLRSMGAMFDWSKEVVTCMPDYYRWNQWFFLQFFKAGLAYKKLAPVDWCPKDQTVLAREQVIGDERLCERCETPVVKRDLEQWFFRITKYADELLDFSKMNWSERVQTLQTNWIGRSEGAEIIFRSESGEAIQCFSTRPDTLYGATFIVLAPEHPLVETLAAPERKAEVEQYVQAARRQSDIDREATDKEKSGFFIGAHATHPLTGARIPITIADYVLMGYGTGAIMGVPAHDERDWAFAKKYNLPTPVVIAPPGWDGQPLAEAYTGEGTMVNSGPFDGTPSADGKRMVAQKLEAIGAGKAAVTYRLRDWLISRQRYWGTPIPIIYCDEHGIVPVPEEDLPVILPTDARVKFNPQGQSPLLFHKKFLNTTCPICGRPARRETDTMDTFVDSSWYQYAFLNTNMKAEPFNRALADQWLPVDQYTGGIDHATMVEKAGERAKKMSKSKGNVVAPDPLVRRYGADTVRAFLMFIGPWDQGGPWDSSGIDGVRKWINRAWSLIVERPTAKGPRPAASDDQIKALRRVVHQTIQRVTDDMEAFKHNTAISALMELTTALARAKEAAAYPATVWGEATRALLLMMAPIAPHVAEELWARLGGAYSIHQQAWPAYDPQAAVEESFTLIVQVNGRVRDRVQVPMGIGEARARELALATPGAQKYLDGKAPRQVIYVKEKLINIVV